MPSSKINEAIHIITRLGYPRGQQNERSGLCLLALLHLTPHKQWRDAQNPLMGITPVMEFVGIHYGKNYAPNTRETFRRQTMHQFLDGGLVRYNPDDPSRPINSPKAVYQITPEALALLQQYGSENWDDLVEQYLQQTETLTAKYARYRDIEKVPVVMESGEQFIMSPGKHSQLIKAVIDEFAPRFTPNAILIYAGDTGEKAGYFNESLLADLGVTVDKHGKMPDVVLYYRQKNWLILVEAVTSHGPVDGKRHAELEQLFSNATAGIVYVTAFPSRSDMARYLTDISWETEVWIAENPTHLIHFDGERFLGPYG